MSWGHGGEYTVGLDLGQAADFTAIAIVQRRRVLKLADELDEQRSLELRLSGSTETFIRRGSVKGRESAFDVVHLDRLPLGTTYTVIVEHTRGLLANPKLSGAALAVDATGVGRPVIDMLRATGLHPVPITITSGSTVSTGAGSYKRVPKSDLIALLAVLLQSKRLKIAAELAHAETLVRELENFQAKASAAGRDTYGAWRESVHDDLVLALAVAVWVAERTGSRNPEDFWQSLRY